MSTYWDGASGKSRVPLQVVLPAAVWPGLAWPLPVPISSCLASLKTPVVGVGAGPRAEPSPASPATPDVGQCGIIFNAVLFPPQALECHPPPLLIHSETDVSALFLAPVIVTAFSSAHFINSFCDRGVGAMAVWLGRDTGGGGERTAAARTLTSCLFWLDQLGRFQALEGLLESI